MAMTDIVLSATLIQNLEKTGCLPLAPVSQRKTTVITYLKTGGQERMAFSINVLGQLDIHMGKKIISSLDSYVIKTK